MTYFVTFSRQGNDEICIAVEANGYEEAQHKAYKTFVEMEYDVCADCFHKPEDVMIVDEDGGELVDEDFEYDGEFWEKVYEEEK